MVFFYKQKAADELRISYWSSDLCSSDLPSAGAPKRTRSAGVRSNEAGIPGREGDSGGDMTPARTASSGSPGCYDHRTRCRLESPGPRARRGARERAEGGRPYGSRRRRGTGYRAVRVKAHVARGANNHQGHMDIFVKVTSQHNLHTTT